MRKRFYIGIFSFIFFVGNAFSFWENKKDITKVRSLLKETVVFIEVACSGMKEKNAENFYKSGVIITEDGHILTSFISEEALCEIKVFKDFKEYPARLVGCDKVGRISIIKIEAEKKLPYLEFSPATAEAGDWLLGMCRLGREHSFAEVFRFNMVESVIPKGSSNVLLLEWLAEGEDGMVVADRTGKLKGIVVPFYTLMLSQSATRDEIIQNELKMMSANLNCIDASAIKHSQIIKEKKSPEISWLGVSAVKLSESHAEYLGIPHRGVSIVKVFKDSPAEESGLLNGDVIYEIDGKPLPADEQGMELFVDIIRAIPPGEKFCLKVFREGRNKEIFARTITYPQMKRAQSNWLGLTVQEIDDSVSTAMNLAVCEGVLVADVEPGGPAFHTEIQKGDLIVEVEFSTVSDLSSWNRMISTLYEKKAETIVLKLYRGKETLIRVIRPAVGGKSE